MDVFSWFSSAIREQLSHAVGAIVMLGASLAWVMHLECSGALKEQGPDRTALIGFLRRGGSWRWRYTRIVNRALDQLDWLLGDKGQSTRACQWVTGRDGTQPCWTGQSFDRCAVLSVAYPLIAVWMVWVAYPLVATWMVGLIQGEADDIGSLLGLRQDETLWRRLLGFFSIILISLAGVRFITAESHSRQFWRISFIGAIAFVVTVTVIVAGTGAGFVAGFGAFAGAVARACRQLTCPAACER